MKKWIALSMMIFALAACSSKEPTIEIDNNVNADVQALVDQTSDDKFASIIYSEQGMSYLLLNATGVIEARLEEDGANLLIQLTETASGTNTPQDLVYQLELHKQYERIHLYLNGEEISFEVWYG